MFKFLKKNKGPSDPLQPVDTPNERQEGTPDANVTDTATGAERSVPITQEHPATELDKATDEKAEPSQIERSGPESGEPVALGVKLKKSRGGFGDRLKSMFGLRKEIDQDLLEEIETLLLTADVGAEASLSISDALSARVKRKELADPAAVWAALRDELRQLLRPVEQHLTIDTSMQPFVILVVGVNGAGKTTTIGKLARKFRDQGHSVMLAAGDTFRAAAVEQLQTWGDRNGVPVVAQATGADSASVIFDALQSAQAKGVDVLIADTAGRLHTQSNLMDELSKIKRVMTKLDTRAPHEVMLVIDGGTGQNAIAQADQFNQAIGLTGVSVTKLDGTAKGGVLFALAKKLALPIRFIGVGESAEDLRVFQADEFIDALIGQDP